MFWGIVLVILCIQLVLLFLLCIPLPIKIRAAIANGFTYVWEIQYVRYVHWACVVFIFGMFIESVTMGSRYSEDLTRMRADEGGKSYRDKMEVQMKLFRAQRNMYISFFTLFHTLVLWGLNRIIKETRALKHRLSPVRKEGGPVFSDTPPKVVQPTTTTTAVKITPVKRVE